MGWVYLLIACVCEITWAVTMKYSEGFTRPWLALLTLAMAGLSFLFMAWAVNHMPLGTGYTVLNSIGTAGVVVFGILLFGESAHPLRLLCVALILVGVVGLRLTMK
jgi:quaternary ammonium compound-resistance protein SugE